jgi:hypothetical protein
MLGYKGVCLIVNQKSVKGQKQEPFQVKSALAARYIKAWEFRRSDGFRVELTLISTGYLY